MKNSFMKTAALALALSVTSGLAATAQTTPPFGTEEDAAYAKKIWAAMVSQRLAGPDQLFSTPYEGTDPHGMMLETFFSKAEIDGNVGDLIVKRNYGPVGVSAEEVQTDPDKFLGSVTVMYRREAGFDAENKDWFWVKFLPDGTLDKNPKGMELAGRVAKGAQQGCIACHGGADGGDFVFLSNAYK
jgi:cytochrome P460